MVVDNQRIFNEIKEQLLDFWTEAVFNPMTSQDCVLMVREGLYRHFGIKKADYLLYEMDVLLPITSYDCNDLRKYAIQWSLVEHCFYSHYREKNSICPIFKERYEYADDLILFIDEHEKPIGVLVVESTELWNSFASSDLFNEFTRLVSRCVYIVRKAKDIFEEKKQYLELFQMTEVFHSTMDIDRILAELLVSFHNIFPRLDSKLILSNDQDLKNSVNIQMFDYLAERPSTIEAFVSGDVTTEQANDLQCRLLNAPLKGRQGIYGILQVTAPIDTIFSQRQKEFIRILAQTSGNALENAKLYHQSHRLVTDLQLINETSHKLNMKLNKSEMIRFLKKQLEKAFLPSAVCFVLLENEEFAVEPASSDIFRSTEGQVYIQHVAEHFQHSAEPLFIADLSRHVKTGVQFLSMMAIPIIIEEKVSGFSIVLHEKSYFFSFDSFKLMQSLIHHSSLAISNTMLRDQLQEMVDLDHLTKLFARKYLDDYVETSLETDECGSFILLDIDDFKTINDTYGHHVGDEVLIQIADHLQKVIGNSGICARWGGEEMAIYLPNAPMHQALSIIEQLIDSIPVLTNPSVTVSSGLVTWTSETKPCYLNIFQMADDALYDAKNNGKNQVKIHENVFS